MDRTWARDAGPPGRSAATETDLVGAYPVCSCDVGIEPGPTGDIVVLRVAGDIDFTSVGIVETALEDALRWRPADLVVDLAGVRFCSVGGFGLLAAAAQGADATVVAVSGLLPHLGRTATLLWPQPPWVRYRSAAAAVSAIRAGQSSRAGTTGLSPEVGGDGLGHDEDDAVSPDRGAPLTRAAAAESVSELLELAVAEVAREVPGAESCGITLVDRHGTSASAASDELVVRVDALQRAAREGPCLDAVRERRTVRCEDLRTERRWSVFTAATVAEGVRSILSFPLSTETGTIGTLSVYSRVAGDLRWEAERVGFLLAAHVATAVVATRRSANLLAAVQHRDVIGQAKGILMERHKIHADRAFALLVASSQYTNLKLHEVARRLTETGELQQGAGL